MMQLGFHTDAFNSAYWNFEQCCNGPAQRPRIHRVRTIDGVSWIHGLGYQPHIALWEDPLLLRRKMDRYGIQSRSSTRLSRCRRPRAPHWALNTSCTRSLAKLAAVRASTRPMTLQARGDDDAEALAHMRTIYRQVVKVAEAYDIRSTSSRTVTTPPNRNSWRRCSSLSIPRTCGLNMDTGNTFIAGQDPVPFLERFIGKVSHVHIKTSANLWPRRRAAN